ncbi:hypothetical protein RF11_14227 [Thelohanellus kitauei]|uniref:Uncharacterized protein n=1 Tax=Thelohanellus kitauei TaxID=669202 RepID=A0A0C2MGM6_THEKT|nr:hypothetical protein RF11_14227 [Thelohanellus kitauei]
MRIIVKEHFHVLADDLSLFFENVTDTPFALARSQFTVKVEDVSEISQEEFIELINSDVAKTDFSSISSKYSIRLDVEDDVRFDLAQNNPKNSRYYETTIRSIFAVNLTW